MTEDQMFGMISLTPTGHESKQDLVMVKDRKPGVLQSLGGKRSDTTELLNNNKFYFYRRIIYIIPVSLKTYLSPHYASISNE